MIESEKLKEKWEEICFYLHDSIKSDIREEFFEGKVLLLLEKLKWRQFKKEIKIKPSLTVGRNTSIQPDFVLYDGHGQALVVVEVKRPIEDLNNENIIRQLISYMRQVRSDFGLLVGQEIHIYYDGDLYPHQEPILLKKIRYEKDLKEGHNFVGIFQRDEFINNENESLLQDWIDEYEKEIKIDFLKQKLLSSDFIDKVKIFVKNEFLEYGNDVVDAALKTININISSNIDTIIVERAFKNSDRHEQVSKPEKEISIEKPYTLGKKYSLEELSRHYLGKSKPKVFQIGDREYEVETWTDLCKYFVKWLIDNKHLTPDKLPVPNAAQQGKYFINSKQSMNTPKKMHFGIELENILLILNMLQIHILIIFLILSNTWGSETQES